MAEDKASRRAELLAALRGTAAEDRMAWSVATRHHLTASDLWKQARSVMVFAALKYEADLLPLLYAADGRRFSFPALENDSIVPRLVRSEDDLILASNGIREPSPRCPEEPMSELDLILVPGLGFAPDGTRMGRGRGYYDRFLAGVSDRTIRCGVCFGCQLQPALPSEPHDVRMDFLLTESGFIPLADGTYRALDAAP